MSKEDESIYDLSVTFRVKIKKWRIDDQNIPDNRHWHLELFDENLDTWIAAMDLNRPGEAVWIASIKEHTEEE